MGLRQTPEHVAHLSRTGFDMSQSFAFTSSVGMLLPVYQDILNVGETVYLNGSLFSRTQPLVTAAMADVDVYLDWFFIPIPMLYQLFPSLRYQTTDYFSSAFQQQVNQYGLSLPLCDFDSVIGNFAGDNRSLFCSNNANFTVGYGSDFDCTGKSVFRLLNHLGYNPYGLFHGVESSSFVASSNPNVFPLYALAYQAIFQNYFRIDDREAHNQKAYNVDWLYNWFDTESQYPLDVFRLNYRPRRKDYFSSVRVSPISASINLANGVDVSGAVEGNLSLLSKVDSFLSDRVPAVAGADSSTSGDFALTQVVARTSVGQAGSINGTGILRSVFAVEKLLRIIGMAKKDYDSQVLAHFGYKVPHDVKHQLTHLFEQHSLLHIGEVVATSDTYNSTGETPFGSALGSIAGKGYVGIEENAKPFKFMAPVDGVVMCIYSAVPRYRYYGTFDKQNAITSRLDFYTPEFDKLGAQPLYLYETDGDVFGDSTHVGLRVGWQNRYAQHKMKYDRVSEAFALLGDNGENQYSAWILAHKPFFDAHQTTGDYYIPYEEQFYVSPKDLNNIMAMDYSTAWASAYDNSPYLMFGTDPFINDFRANVKKVSTMSPTGEPDL